jgi:hypothetical protein
MINMNKCINCETETKNPRFCSRSCSASYNNKIAPKIQKKFRYCEGCNVEVDSRRRFCDDCNSNKVKWSLVTLGEVKALREYQAHSRIRDLARRWYIASDKPKNCCNCGYDKHFEVCHIHAIKDFPDDATVTEINDLNNLIALCPNCHWELDHNLLTL